MICRCSDLLILVRSKGSIHAGLSDSVSPNYLLVLFSAFSEDHNENLLQLSVLFHETIWGDDEKKNDSAC